MYVLSGIAEYLCIKLWTKYTLKHCWTTVVYHIYFYISYRIPGWHFFKDQKPGLPTYPSIYCHMKIHLLFNILIVLRMYRINGGLKVNIGLQNIKNKISVRSTVISLFSVSTELVYKYGRTRIWKFYPKSWDGKESRR